MSRRRRGRVPAGGPAPEPAAFPWAWAVFGASLLARLFFWRATPDAAWPHSAAFKADALLWAEYARALHAGVPFELGLPIHPPGAGYLVAALWDGGAFVAAKAAWCAMGAAAAGLFTAAIVRAFGARAGAVAGLVLTGATGLLVLSTSLNGETPYLALVAAGFWLVSGVEARPSAARLAAWGALQGVACLFRVEHLLFTALAAAFLAARAGRWGGPRALLAAAAVLAAGFAAPLVPWHVKAWREVERFNTVAEPPPPAVRQLLGALRTIPWEPSARARLLALPAFARDQAEAFVTATAVHRGRVRVTDAEFAALGEAFGPAPRPLAPRPFVSLYGPLNFALASHPLASPGFGHAALDQPPPLAGGPAAYPAMLIAGLPPRELAFIYPPHVALVNDGYAMGLGWLRQDPAGAVRRALVRGWRFWSGAATTVGGYGLPSGLSGTRFAVDMVVATGWTAEAWRMLVLVASAAGVAAAARNPALVPWALFFLSRAAAAVLFFGYARLGATAIPVVALLAGLAAARWLRFDENGRRARLALGALVALELVRLMQGPGLAIDGQEATRGRDPVPAADQLDHEIRVVF